MQVVGARGIGGLGGRLHGAAARASGGAHASVGSHVSLGGAYASGGLEIAGGGSCE